jgi:hypothetical protein
MGYVVEEEDVKPQKESFSLSNLIPQSWKNIWNKNFKYFVGGAVYLGNVLWIVATSTIIMLIPLRRTLELEMSLGGEQSTSPFGLGGSPQAPKQEAPQQEPIPEGEETVSAPQAGIHDDEDRFIEKKPAKKAKKPKRRPQRDDDDDGY